MRIDCFFFPLRYLYLFHKYYLIVYHVKSTVLVTVEEIEGVKTSSVFLQDGNERFVWKLVVAAPVKEIAEWEGLEKVRMRNKIVKRPA